MFEHYGIYSLAAGAGLLLVGAVWLVVRAFRVRLGWGLAVLFLPVAGAVAFLIWNFRTCRGPLALLALGGLVTGGTYAVSFYQSHFAPLGPRERLVDGEVHVTLTGWNEKDYAVLSRKPDTVVLQMANEDVTDQTLEHLRGMKKLRELDLNNTQVSDDGLRLLGELPRLQIVRLRKTGVTDDGFRQYLGPKDSLLELDLRETKVSSKTLREWKAQRPDLRKYLR